MRKSRYIYIIGLVLGLGLLLTLSGCSSDHDDVRVQPDQPGLPDNPSNPELPGTRELHLKLGSLRYLMSRGSGDLPDGFLPYDHATALAPITQIQTYLTYMEGTAPKYVSSDFSYQQSDGNWVSRVALNDGQYYFYGFMPKGGPEGGVTVEPYNSDFKNGVVLTLKDLNAVSPEDVCVIVGVEGYGSSTANVPDMSSRLGCFDYHTENGDNLFLLVDHIYAGLRFNMKLGDTYSQLRGIKVKSIRLIPKDGDNNVVEAVNATVTIAANENNTDPIVRVDFENSKMGTRPAPAVLYDGEGKALTTADQLFLACLCPLTNKKFVLETKYDVYDRDKEGNLRNLIREGETASNVINLQRDLEKAGMLHQINITVQPTYIYMLSDPDLDNPTFSIED